MPGSSSPPRYRTPRPPWSLPRCKPCEAKILDPRRGDDPGTQRIEVYIDATKLTQDPSEAAAAVDEAPLTLVFTLGSNGEIVTVFARLSPPATASDDETFGYRTTD